MRFSKMINTVDTHTAGHPTRTVFGGIPPLPGRTMAEKVQYAREHLLAERALLLNEPRGHGAMAGAIVTEPVSTNADVGVIYLEPDYFPPMCGHSTIGVATSIIETGYLPLKEPATTLTFDTPAGLVKVQVNIKNKRAHSVTFKNVPSFSLYEDITIEVPGIGPLTMDISYGGNFYAMIAAQQLQLKLEPQEQDQLLALAIKIKKAVNEQLAIKHPLQPEICECNYVQFFGPSITGAFRKNAVVYPPVLLDRSPCGTGTSAAVATLYKKGLLALEEPFVHESIIGTTFRGRATAEAQIGELSGIIPEITGSAYIMRMNTLVLDPEDPFPQGFII